jgi:hypothetical protein
MQASRSDRNNLNLRSIKKK